jgi:hypothetical protein
MSINNGKLLAHKNFCNVASPPKGALARARPLAGGGRSLRPLPGRERARTGRVAPLLEATGARSRGPVARGREVREDSRANVLPKLRERRLRDSRRRRDFAPLLVLRAALRDVLRERDPRRRRSGLPARRGLRLGRRRGLRAVADLRDVRLRPLRLPG